MAFDGGAFLFAYWGIGGVECPVLAGPLMMT